MRMCEDAPGSPDDWLTWTFGALPASAWTSVGSLLRMIWSADTVLRTVPIFSTSDDVPAPVMTTSRSWSGFVSREKSWVTVPERRVISIVVGLYPMSRAVIGTVWP